MQSVIAKPSNSTDMTAHQDLAYFPGPWGRSEVEETWPADETNGLPTNKTHGGRDSFTPKQPTNVAETGLPESEIEALILKLMLLRGKLSGRTISERIRLPFALVESILWRLMNSQLIGHSESAPMNDYVYRLSENGREKARRNVEHCGYFGAAPVPLDAYIRSVKAQSISDQRPTFADLQCAFADILLPPQMLARLGPAINSGHGFLLHGAAGNGKTSIAERVTHAFGDSVWVPRALGIDGEIVRLFDPLNHEEMPLDESKQWCDSTRHDHRWVRIRRPTIIVGGELTMDDLEISFTKSTGIGEAPLQLKSNCGTLVIDDFGRQRISVEQLLNRWIVPMEKRYDFLRLASGKKIQVPFDQLVIFSTNLPLRDLVHESFLRRIPYKIEAEDPSEEVFRTLLRLKCRSLNIPYETRLIDYLIDKHYKAQGRPYRYCQPRDLMLQIRNYCLFHDVPMKLTEENIDDAVCNYFSFV
jgi:predicted ATPase with chaperone activity